jgi:hypothetical protein
MDRGEQSSPRFHAIRSCPVRSFLGLLAGALLLAAARPAAAQLRTCVRVEAGKTDAQALTRLVKAELDRHPSHRAVDQDCQGYLTVELIDVGGPQNERWVNGRINTQVPFREKVGADGIGPAVQRLLSVVLNNDPLILQGPEANTWLRRQGRALERRSVMHFGAELFELGARLGGTFDTLPGLALTARREVSALYVGARVGGAFNPDSGGDRLHLRAQFDAQVEAALYASPAENTSLFAAALLGLSYHRFEGPATFDGAGATGTATSAGLSFGLRGGVETLRTADVRVLAFLQVTFPGYVSGDPDHGVVDQWVPTAALGAGVLY